MATTATVFTVVIVILRNHHDDLARGLAGVECYLGLKEMPRNNTESVRWIVGTVIAQQGPRPDARRLEPSVALRYVPPFAVVTRAGATVPLPVFRKLPMEWRNGVAVARIDEIGRWRGRHVCCVDRRRALVSLLTRLDSRH